MHLYILAHIYFILLLNLFKEIKLLFLFLNIDFYICFLFSLFGDRRRKYLSRRQRSHSIFIIIILLK